MAEKDRAASRMVGEGVHRRRVKQEDRLRMAAALSFSLGQMQQYCELLIQLGNGRFGAPGRPHHRPPCGAPLTDCPWGPSRPVGPN